MNHETNHHRQRLTGGRIIWSQHLWLLRRNELVFSSTQTAPHVGGRARGGVQNTPHAGDTVTAINGDTPTLAADDLAGTTEYTVVPAKELTITTHYDAGHDSSGTVSSDGKTIIATNLSIMAGGPIPGH